MARKYIYMVNKKDHATACLSDAYYVPVLKKAGFVRCSNAEYFRWHWGTWEDEKFAYIDRRPDEKKKRDSSD